MRDGCFASLFFAGLETIGSAAMKRLIEAYGDENEIFGLSESVIDNSNLLSKRQKDEFLTERKKWNYEKEKEKLAGNNIQFVTMNMEGYPARLRTITGKPYALFYKGRLPAEGIKYVSIIGARSCSDYGRNCAEYFGGELAKKGIGIISGLASGIDGIAQRAAINNGGVSYGILGNGPDICYPSSNRDLYESLETLGGIISEYKPGTKPDSFRFPARNRIISGLSDIVLVVEARAKSGTAITVNMALEQGKDVFAVPGRICDELSRGCNNIIKDGGGVAGCVDDIVNELGMMSGLKEETATSDNVIISKLNDNVEKEIYAAVGKGLFQMDKIIEYICKKNDKVEISEIMSRVVKMEMEGIVQNRGGRYYI